MLSSSTPPDTPPSPPQFTGLSKLASLPVTRPNYTIYPSRQHTLQQTTFPFQCAYCPITHQHMLITNTTNNHWGDHPNIGTDNTAHCLQVISHNNVNTINQVSHATSWQALTQATHDLKADILCLQETNTNWTSATIQTASCIINNTTYHAHKLTVSVSSERTYCHYQQGSTFIAALGQLTAWVTCTGQDDSGLGWWSYIEIQGSNNITSYLDTELVPNPPPTWLTQYMTSNIKSSFPKVKFNPNHNNNLSKTFSIKWPNGINTTLKVYCVSMPMKILKHSIPSKNLNH